MWHTATYILTCLPFLTIAAGLSGSVPVPAAESRVEWTSLCQQNKGWPRPFACRSGVCYRWTHGWTDQDLGVVRSRKLNVKR
jgi:hypothetical protein